MRLSLIASIPRMGFRTLNSILSMKSQVTCRRGAPLAANGLTGGRVEVAIWTRHQVELRGWFVGDELFAGLSGAILVPCQLEAIEARQRHGLAIRGSIGFHVRLGRTSRRAPVSLKATHGQTSSHFQLSPPSLWRETIALILALPAAFRLVARHRNDIVRFLRTRDAGLSVSLRDAFGFNQDQPAPLVSPEVMKACPATSAAHTGPIVIIVPIHNAPRQVARLFGRLATTLDSNHRLLLIDDGSTDPAIGPLLATFAEENPERVRIVTLQENLGFVAAINHGLDIARELGEHVIILNTDTLPPAGWANRLIAPILADPDVASVTPLSNNAEIASIPNPGIHSDVTPELVDTIDGTAARLGEGWRMVEIPTGIGFAMAMNRRFLDRIGGFDPAFGRGYGEEVDWCQKARQAGGKNVLATSVFIGHEGGASFGAAEKNENLASSSSIIRSRYPGYNRAVQDWAEAAPHAIQRMILSLPYLEATSPDAVPIYVAHSLGGGAEMVLRREVDALVAAGAPGVVILRAGGATKWRLEVEGNGFRHACRIAETETLLTCLAPVRRRRVIYSCGAGVRDPRDIPGILLALASEAASSLELRLHDFFPISPSYCLLDRSGRFRGLPDPTRPDPAHDLPSISGRRALPLSEWRNLWRPVIDRADRITAYSQSSAHLLAAAYPAASRSLRIEPHVLPPDMPGAIAPGGRSIGVLGGVNQAKGAEVLMALSKELGRRKKNRKIVVIGGMDPGFRLPRPHCVTGPYDRRDISALACRHHVGVWLIPSVWPETFSFATREALATGLPVLTFDLGAQAEAARSARNGLVLSIDPFDSAALLAQLEQAFDRSIL